MLPAQENWIVTEVQVESGFQEKGEIQESKVGKQKEHLSKNQGTQGPMESQTVTDLETPAVLPTK